MAAYRGFLVVSCVVGTSLTARAACSQAPALRRLRTVKLYVPPVDASGVAAPDSTRLGDIIELRLRREGLDVKRGLSDSVHAYLKFEVICLQSRVYPVLSCGLTLSLKEWIDLREGRGAAYADVWTRGQVLSVNPTAFYDGLEKSTNDLVDDFILDWLRENPKKPP